MGMINLPVNTIKKGEEILGSDIFKNHLIDILNEEAKPKNFKLIIDDEVEFKEDIMIEFIEFCLDYLKVADGDHKLKIVLSSEKEKFATYAFYDLQNKIAAVYCVGRAIIDCMRSLAHELVHYKQDIKNEIPKEQVSDNNDGVPIEDEANAVAGIIMRKFGRNHPELY